MANIGPIEQKPVIIPLEEPSAPPAPPATPERDPGVPHEAPEQVPV